MIRASILSKKFPKVRLGDVVEFLDHKRKPITAKDRIAGPYPYYGANGQQDSVADYIFDEPLVLLAEDGGHFGSPNRTIAYQIDGKSWVNNHAHVLRPKPNIDIRYLCRHLEFYDVSPIINGATRQKLNKSAAQEIILSLPPLKEQKRIAVILDKADAMRRKRQQAIQLSEQFLRSVFLDMFGDPVTNLKGLPTSSLIEVSKKVTDGTHQSPVWSETGIPFLFISNIINNEISFEVDKYITEKNWLELTKNSPIEEGDVLYTTVGSYGNAALVKENSRFCFQRHIAHIKPIKNIIHPTFLWVMMNSPGIKKQADKQARGIAQKTLNLGELKQFIIFVPPMSKQIEFVNIVTQHKAILNKLIAKSSLANNLFISLTQQAFSGELNNQTKVEST